MDPLQGSSIHFKNRIHQIKSKWEKGIKNCQISKKTSCKDVLTKLHQDLRNSDKKTFALMKKKIKNGKIKVEAKFRLNEELGKILNLNYKILHLIEENLILYSQNQGRLPQKKLDRIDYLLQRIFTHAGNTLTLFLESKLKKNFEFLWVNFIQNLETKIIYEKNSPYLLTRLGDLNIAWNSFHMKISKGEYKLTKSSRKILKNMHSRWNSILKIILAP
jgi:ABC-type antimicrobial peptide transport system permease subunit